MALSDEEGSLLFRALKAVFGQQAAFGGIVTGLAANSMDELLHNNPRVFRSMEEVGLPMAYI